MIDKSTLEFLQGVELNNNKLWFDEHKDWYLQSLDNVLNLTTDWLQYLSERDSEFQYVEPKKSIFRIYRDARFSKDKRPYKTHFGVSLSKEGRKSMWAGFHLHIQPGDRSFIGAGRWRPASEELRVIRQEIDYNYEVLMEILNDATLQSEFGSLSQIDSLRTAPRGYDVSHPAIQFLRLRSFILSKPLTDEEVLSSNFLKQLQKDSESLFPFVHYLNEALTDLL